MASLPVTSVPMSLPSIVPPVVPSMVMALNTLPEIRLPAPAAVPPIWKPSAIVDVDAAAVGDRGGARGVRADLVALDDQPRRACEREMAKESWYG